jgi:uncharacterized membrane protein
VLHVSPAIALLALRWLVAGRPNFAHLPLNLALAAIPLAVAGVIDWLHHRSSRHTWLLVAAGIVWLLFLPNAQYMWTNVSRAFYPYVRVVGAANGRAWNDPYDSAHWFDVMLILTFAWTAMLMGLLSLDVFHHVAAARLGRRAGWVLVVIAMLCQSLGVAAGRLYRMNSWEPLLHPIETASYVLTMAPDLHLFAELSTTAAASFIFFGLAYATMLASMEPSAGVRDDRSPPPVAR